MRLIRLAAPQHTSIVGAVARDVVSLLAWSRSHYLYLIEVFVLSACPQALELPALAADALTLWSATTVLELSNRGDSSTW